MQEKHTKELTMNVFFRNTCHCHCMLPLLLEYRMCSLSSMLLLLRVFICNFVIYFFILCFVKLCCIETETFKFSEDRLSRMKFKTSKTARGLTLKVCTVWFIGLSLKNMNFRVQRIKLKGLQDSISNFREPNLKLCTAV